MMQENLSHFEGLLAEWRARGWIVDMDAALARSLYATSLHKELVGHDRYPHVVDLLVESLAERLCPDDFDA